MKTVTAKERSYIVNQVIRISDQHIFDSISSAASSVDTLPNYLAKCIRERKFCKGDLFEFYKGRGCNTSSEQYAKMVAKKKVKKTIREDEQWDKMCQRILLIMSRQAEMTGMPVEQVYKKFIEQTEARFE